jgi:hypothetical protein
VHVTPTVDTNRYISTATHGGSRSHIIAAHDRRRWSSHIHSSEVQPRATRVRLSAVCGRYCSERCAHYPVRDDHCSKLISQLTGPACWGITNLAKDGTKSAELGSRRVQENRAREPPLTQHGCCALLASYSLSKSGLTAILFQRILVPSVARYGDKERGEREWRGCMRT